MKSKEKFIGNLITYVLKVNPNVNCKIETTLDKKTTWVTAESEQASLSVKVRSEGGIEVNASSKLDVNKKYVWPTYLLTDGIKSWIRRSMK